MRTKRKRLKQVHRWLEDNFPGPRPTVMQFHRDQKSSTSGHASWDGGVAILIRINTWFSEHECIQALIEEHAHAAVLTKTELHTKPWGDAYWKRRHAFDDKGGDRDSLRL